jgi:cytochrome c oxidase subunit 1
MVLFAFGGISGITNASYNVNLVVHNTTWVPGHFHLTVGTATTLSFIGITYWLLPKITGKVLWSRRVALAQVWFWFVGMALFSNSLHLLGLRFGVPRRTMLGAATYLSPAWQPFLTQAAIGGVLLLVSLLLYFANVLGTVFASRPLPEPVEMPVAESLTDPQRTPAWLDAWVPWLVATVILIVISYGPTLFELIRSAQLTSPGFKAW